MTDTVRCHCPDCGKVTTQIVFRDRQLVPVSWCRKCFAVAVHPLNDDGEWAGDGPQHSMAEVFLVSRMKM